MISSVTNNHDQLCIVLSQIITTTMNRKTNHDKEFKASLRTCFELADLQLSNIHNVLNLTWIS